MTGLLTQADHRALAAREDDVTPPDADELEAERDAREAAEEARAERRAEWAMLDRYEMEGD